MADTSKNRTNPSGFLARLRRDERGNFLMISAAAIFPLVGVIGAGVDLSRAYVAKSRLQNACDAGALAGRRTIAASTWTETNRTTALNFFNTNFPTGIYGTTNLAVGYEANASLVVTGTASVDVPTSLMALFGKTTIPVAVTCDAEMQVPNSDIMFVLDTTGSMADTNPGDTVSKIAALRLAVTGFYTTLQGAKTPAAQVRYGFVPYATTVNVGYLLQRDWMVDKWTYQSRIPDGDPVVTTKTTTTTTTTSSTTSAWTTLSGTATTFTSYLPLEACVAPSNTSGYTDSTVVTGPVVNGDGSKTTTTVRTRTTNGSSYSVAISSGKCKLTEVRYNAYVQRRTETNTTNLPPTTSTSTTTTTTYNWIYKPVEYDVSGLKGSKADGTMAGGSVNAPVGNNFAPRKVVWNGCIEERDTENSTDYTKTSLHFYDLDVDLIPKKGDQKTQWRPALGALVFARKGIDNWDPKDQKTTGNPSGKNWANIYDYFSAGFYASCPTPAKKLSEINASDLDTYLNSLSVSGNTYHDIGFLWGLRLLSPTGLFQAENTTATNGGSIQRHLIFMTDGDTETKNFNYEAYGLSALDRRRNSDKNATPTDSEQDAIVEGRLQYLCTQAKARNITVWVIAFGTGLTSLLSDCASPGRSFQADNATQLNDTFTKIATQISQLRLTR